MTSYDNVLSVLLARRLVMELPLR